MCYYPYLRGKQFEFLALRELSEELSNEQKRYLLPIIEPVKKTFRDAFAAINVMQKKNLRFAFILNPMLGDFQELRKEIYNGELKQILPSEDTFWQPAFILQGHAESIINTINSEHLQQVLLIMPKNEEIDRWIPVLKLNQVSTIVTCNADSRSTVRKLRSLNKAIVRLDDCFQQETRNRDFSGKEDQFFNDNHAYFSDEGFSGFGDFTTMPAAYSEGGMLPYVVAIHFTYNKSNDEIWIHHFLSDSNINGTENIQTKFREAAQKVIQFFDSNTKDSTRSIKDIQKYLDDGHYPGLGMLKKLSVKHHLTLMCQFLENNKL